MAEEYTYKDYASSAALYKKYSAYQKRYAGNIRESDKILIQMIQTVLAGRPAGKHSLLDLGCSTGNLLFNIKQTLADTGLHLSGGDLMADVIAECEGNPELAGIDFFTLDALKMSFRAKFDIVVSNALIYLFDEQQLRSVFENVCRALKPGSHFLVFDFAHKFEQVLEIKEYSRSHPDGLTLHFRPESQLAALLTAAGFTDIAFHPFQIPVDLPQGNLYGKNSDGFEDLNSYTMHTDNRTRLLFRGALFQPWCHYLAKKAV